MSVSLVRASLPCVCGTGTAAAAVGSCLRSRLRRPACSGSHVSLRCSATTPPEEMPSIDTPPDFEAPLGVDVPMPGTPVPGTPPSPEQPGPSIPSPQTPEIPTVPPNPDIPPWSAPEIPAVPPTPEVVPPQPSDVPPPFV